jgi:hypothetical protein
MSFSYDNTLLVAQAAFIIAFIIFSDSACLASNLRLTMHDFGMF